MIIKFCYQDEIHRCSDPPKDFASLHSFLTPMFRTQIPSQIELFYTNAEGQTIFLNTEQDYQELMRTQSSKPVKILIIERKCAQDEKDPLNGEFEREEAAEYEVIPNYDDDQRIEVIEEKGPEIIMEIPDREEADKIEPNHPAEEQIILNHPQEKQDELTDVIDKLSEKISEKYIMPQVHSNPIMEPAQVKSLVKEALREEMPFIIAQVRDSLLKEGQIPAQSKPAEISQSHQDPQQRNKLPLACQTYYSYPYYYQQQPINGVNMYPGQINQASPQMSPQTPPQMAPQGPSQVIPPQGFYQAPPNVMLSQRQATQPQVQVNSGVGGAGQQMGQVNRGNRERQPRLFDRVVSSLGGHINKASEMVDNFVQKFEGDPYVQCAEGKYNKSVVEKVALFRDIFPEEDKKELLEFTQRFPRDAPLDQLAEVYWSKKKMMK